MLVGAGASGPVLALGAGVAGGTWLVSEGGGSESCDDARKAAPARVVGPPLLPLPQWLALPLWGVVVLAELMCIRFWFYFWCSYWLGPGLIICCKEEEMSTQFVVARTNDSVCIYLL